MRLTGTTEPQLTEAAHVLSVLIQIYASHSDAGGINKAHAENVLRGLILALDDVAQTRQGVGRPIPELIRAFNLKFNPLKSPYTVVVAQHPFEFNANSDTTNFDGLADAMQRFGEEVNALAVGWVAVWSNQECRMIGEAYL
jgi:hypothetical protein